MKQIDVRFLDTKAERDQFYRLRHRVFTVEKQWVESEEKETDKFDEFGEFLGVFFQGVLVACMRIIKHEFPWMFDSVFAHLLKEPIKKDPQSIELTRYFVAPEFRKIQTIDGQKILFSKLLQQYTYEFCLIRNYIYTYSAFTYRVYRLFQLQGLPAVNLNEDIEIGDDMETAVPVLMRADRTNIERFLDKGLAEVVNFHHLRN